jgi:5'-deoxynucleotidase YfbR-like HD superfamily hydrolase
MPSTSPLSLRELLIGDPSRMAHTYRFQTQTVVKRESNAEHAYLTVLYTYFLLQWCSHSRRHLVISREEALCKALFHDFEECRSGDIIRPFKHANPELEELIHSTAKAMVRDVAERTAGMATAREVTSLWNSAKDFSYEGRIVRFADFLSVLGHMWCELLSGNLHMHRHAQEMLEYADSFSCYSFEFLHPLVQEAQRITIDLFNRDKDVRDV